MRCLRHKIDSCPKLNSSYVTTVYYINDHFMVFAAFINPITEIVHIKNT